MHTDVTRLRDSGGPRRRPIPHRAWEAFVFLLIGAGLAGCPRPGADPGVGPGAGASAGQRGAGAERAAVPAVPDVPDATAVLPAAPGLEERRYIAPLEDAYARVDPAVDGWETEALGTAAGEQLASLAAWVETGWAPGGEGAGAPPPAVAGDAFTCAPLRPADLTEAFDSGAVRVLRAANADKGPAPGSGEKAQGGPGRLGAAVEELLAGVGLDAHPHLHFKVVGVVPGAGGAETFSTAVRVELSGGSAGGTGRAQVTAQWECRWEKAAADADDVGEAPPPRLRSVRVTAYEEVHIDGAEPWFGDATAALLGGNPSFREQLGRGTDYWRARIPRDLGLDVVANHGLAVGDMNGDGLDDLYLCQQGGLPNRLFIQRPGGTLKDATATSGADWLDYCAAALLVDLDNDGDRDLVVAQEWKLLLMSNDGEGKFTLEFGTGTHAQTFSLAAADYDLDGDLDLFACGYNPAAGSVRQGAIGEPIPFHDAQNGGRNILLRNGGGWDFDEVTAAAGLDANSRRYSFAAAWEDYDEDGDPDLYVANDYGRNNLYRNDGGTFVDVAPELGVEDMSAGMSASWGDFNRDGRMDLYVSNMFSSAGNRVTFQRQFKAGTPEEVRAQFRRHARGNTLFAGSGGGPFEDVSVAAGVTMGRWAWGSKFADLDGDGWEDLVVANGFITAPDPGDL